MVVESAWTYRHPPRISKMKLYRLEQAPPKIREIALEGADPADGRYRALTARGKTKTVVRTAIAPGLVGFSGRPPAKPRQSA